MNKIISVAILSVLISLTTGICENKKDLFATVEALGIQCRGYTLGSPLSKEQKAHALRHLEKASSPKIYRFRDRNLNIVADKETHRVLVMFESFEEVGKPEIQDLVGDLCMRYGDPTISAHDKVVYWAWGEKEKYTTGQYEEAKEKKTPLSIIATVKLNSEAKIMERDKRPAKGDIYYIISSDPLLKFYKDN